MIIVVFRCVKTCLDVIIVVSLAPSGGENGRSRAPRYHAGTYVTGSFHAQSVLQVVPHQRSRPGQTVPSLRGTDAPGKNRARTHTHTVFYVATLTVS